MHFLSKYLFIKNKIKNNFHYLTNFINIRIITFHLSHYLYVMIKSTYPIHLSTFCLYAALQTKTNIFTL
jgi:hypothetical protein